jgi:hypothetical protein
MAYFFGNYLSKLSPVLARTPAASDFEAMDGESSSDWLDVTAFKRELEALRLRMIDACLRQSEVAADAPDQFSSDLAVVSQAASLPIAEDSRATHSVQDAVTNAVRLLSYGAYALERRVAALPSGKELARPHARNPFQRERD